MSNSWSRRRKSKRQTRQPAPLEAEIEISGLGAGGDGVARWRDAPVYAPGLLPGERALVDIGGRRGEGRLAETRQILALSPDRVEPPCPHAGQCGGCAVQHLADAAYAAWKSDLLDRALSARALAPETRGALVRFEEGRRRLRFAVRGRAEGPVFGFNGKASKRIVDIDACLAATPALADAPTKLRPLLAKLLQPGEPADVEALAAAAGLDVLIVRRRPFDLPEREAIAEAAARLGLARVAWRADDRDAPEIVAERTPPSLDIAGAVVTPPPGAFLQPTAAGEAAMAAFAAERLAGAGRIADLYAGWGAFALRLARPAHVAAYEGDAAMIDCLNRAAGAANLGGFLKGEARDLARQPLLGAELRRLDGVVLDPPRGGAPAQAEALAADGPPRVVYLSCNPAALARDARVLVDGGYRFVEATPIDQFRWTPHLEVAAYFERAG